MRASLYIYIYIYIYIYTRAPNIIYRREVFSVEMGVSSGDIAEIKKPGSTGSGRDRLSPGQHSGELFSVLSTTITRSSAERCEEL